MKPNLTLSTTGQHARNQSSTANAVAARSRAIGGDTGMSQLEHARPLLTLASARVWRHTVILTGELDYRSAFELEEEIECLSQEGVTNLTLDLRQLDAIDSTGVSVIASGGAAWKMRGHDFTVVPGSPVIHHALTEGGAGDLVTLEPNASVARRFSNRSLDGPFSERSTAMIKALCVD